MTPADARAILAGKGWRVSTLCDLLQHLDDTGRPRASIERQVHVALTPAREAPLPWAVAALVQLLPPHAP